MRSRRRGSHGQTSELLLGEPMMPSFDKAALGFIQHADAATSIGKQNFT